MNNIINCILLTIFITTFVTARITPNITLPNSFELQLISQDFGFPNIVNVRMDGINDRILLNSTLDVSPFDPVQMLALSLDVNTRTVYWNLDQTCKRQAIPYSYFYPFKLSTFFTLYQQYAEYKGIVGKNVTISHAKKLENFHKYQIRGEDLWSENKVNGVLRTYYRDVPGTPLYQVEIVYKGQLFTYTVSEEIIEKEYTLQDFQFNDCSTLTIMQSYRIYEIYSAINELVKELYEKYKGRFS